MPAIGRRPGLPAARLRGARVTVPAVGRRPGLPAIRRTGRGGDVGPVATPRRIPSQQVRGGQGGLSQRRVVEVSHEEIRAGRCGHRQEDGFQPRAPNLLPPGQPAEADENGLAPALLELRGGVQGNQGIGPLRRDLRHDRVDDDVLLGQAAGDEFFDQLVAALDAILSGPGGVRLAHRDRHDGRTIASGQRYDALQRTLAEPGPPEERPTQGHLQGRLHSHPAVGLDQ